MYTTLQQILASGVLLLFGLLAVRVWRRAGPVRHDRAALAWGVTAAYFIVSGGYSVAHSVLSAAAVSAGKESAFFKWWGGLAVPANLARGGMSVVFALMLLALMVSRRRWVLRLALSATGVTVASAIVLTAVAMQLPNTIYWLGTGLAVLSTITAMVIMGALLAAVLNDGMDQLLWLALALYALKETLSVSLMAIVAWWSLATHGEAWHFFYWCAAVLGAGMCGLAVRRLRLAGAGRRVPALFERVYTLRRSPAR